MSHQLFLKRLGAEGVMLFVLLLLCKQLMPCVAAPQALSLVSYDPEPRFESLSNH